ncbi:MAG: ABC-F family ATP-binding cassette domain-containing protein [Actinomycetota bacterium]
MSVSLSFHDVTVARGASIILSNVDLVIAPGQRIGIVGPNGVGKSTLLATAAGAIRPDDGVVRTTPPSATIGWLRQEPERADESVRDAIARRTGVTEAQTELENATTALAADAGDAAERYDVALTRWLSLGAADLDARIGSVFADLGLGSSLAEAPTAVLSGGEAARVGLASLLLSRFDVQLLDEPTNDLDAPGLDVLERWALGLDAPTLLVSHDRRFLERVVTDVIEIDEFSHEIAIYGGGWSAYVEERETSRRHARERYERYDTERRALAARAQRQREWAQQGQARVRRATSNDEPDKNIKAFRLAQTEQLAAKSAQTKRAMERLEEVDEPREGWELRLDIPTAGRSGDVVARVSGAVVDRGRFRLGPIDLLIGWGERIALLGDNGTGKSTLIEVVLGRTRPDDGSSVLGTGVVVGEIEQARQQLDADRPLLRVLADETGWQDVEVRTLLAKFGLVADHVTRPTSSLSPGERTRAVLALLMARGANLLVLDEPTNHLDLPAIEQLEQALDTFGGTVIVVTHDRVFLDALRVTRRIRLADGRVASDEPA